MEYLIMLVVMIGCALSKEQQSEPFMLLQASVQEQRAGVHGGDSSKDYAFKIVVNTGQKIVFDSVWVDGQTLGIRVEKDGHLLRKEEPISRNDTLILHASSIIPSDPDSSTPTKTAKSNPPVTLTGKALITYRHTEKPGYFTVPDIRELPPVIMH